MKQQGGLLIAAILMIVVFGSIAFTIADMDVHSTRTVANVKDHQDSFDIAEAGLNRAVYALTASTPADQLTCATITSHADMTDVTFGAGKFTAIATLYTPSDTALSAAISSFTGVIPVASVSGYASSGQIKINSERINYTSLGTSSGECGSGISACFLGATRGQSGTTAASHSSADAVDQNMCAIQSTGVIPDFTSINSRTELYVDVSIAPGAAGDSDNWIVGRTSSGDTMVAGSADNYVRVGPVSTVPNQHLNAIFSSSATDAWAVGARNSGELNINKYDGSGWVNASVANGLMDSSAEGVNKHLYGVTCTNAGDCWAVGQSQTFVRYLPSGFGSHWVYNSDYIDTSGSDKVESEAYYGISCFSNGTSETFTANGPTSYDCWAVGTPYSGNSLPTFVFWDGTALTPEWKKSTAYNSCVAGENLRAVTCVGSEDCWAVGDRLTSTSSGCPSTEMNVNHWDGEEWSRVATADDPDKTLRSVACVSANECYAVGDRADSHGLIMKYDGTDWTQLTGAAVSAVPNENLYGVSCAATGDCLAVGDNGTIVRLEGSTWSDLSIMTTTFSPRFTAVEMLGSQAGGGGGAATYLKTNWRED